MTNEGSFGTVIAIALILQGCATAPPDPATAAEANRPLICTDKAQCDLFWQRAQVWIAQNSKYRIQSVTDTVLTTHGPLRSDTNRAYQLTRVPDSQGGARILIATACGNIWGCSPSEDVAIASFKVYVRDGK